MFLDELEEVLKQVPYNVWEKVVGDTVDSVTIKRRWYPPSDQREKIIVYVRSGIITHAIEGLDTLDDREETLVRCWKPYRRLVEREVRAFNQLLEQPTEYMTASLTEKEFDRRLDDFFWPKIRIGYYAHCFGLETYMKDKCFGEVNCAKELDELFVKRRIVSGGFGGLFSTKSSTTRRFHLGECRLSAEMRRSFSGGRKGVRGFISAEESPLLK